ncbi:MAG: SIS domain-containing protein [Planctomycetes bacterium]|nr:SIS domain-containing protein [Planctomycetota bacterium]MCB9881698.1 SIS domain-containing protein [Planctomycetota bacterium]MCB9916931.1 SIS domain-containing protein [Planctomycetota bacterium]
MDRDRIESEIRESLATKQRFLEQSIPALETFFAKARACIDRGGKLLFCGNGGSSCDAAHAAGELVGWFLEKQRGPIPAIALGHEVPALTAIANDSGYEFVFSRHLEAVGRAGDLLVGISTSGGSKNVLRAIQRAGELGIESVAWTGELRGPCAEAADLWLPVPSTSTPRIQECHLLIVHLLCAHLEEPFGG